MLFADIFSHSACCLFNFFKFHWGIIYNVVLVSGVQQSEPITRIHVSILHEILSHVGHCRALRQLPVLYGGFLFVTYVTYVVLFITAQVALVVKNPPASAGDTRDSGSIPGSGSSPGGGHGNPLQYSGWRIPWTEELGGATGHGVAESNMT